jgi:hypothetical protein
MESCKQEVGWRQPTLGNRETVILSSTKNLGVG